jgi:hypothetical protein
MDASNEVLVVQTEKCGAISIEISFEGWIYQQNSCGSGWNIIGRLSSFGF